MTLNVLGIFFFVQLQEQILGVKLHHKITQRASFLWAELC